MRWEATKFFLTLLPIIKTNLMKNSFLLLVVLLSSCKPVIIFLAGAHNPKPEDKESLIRYLDKKDIPADNILVLVDSTFFYRKHRDLGGIPEIQVFNKHGILINYKDTGSSCSGPAEFFTKAICSANVLSSNSSKTIESELKDLVTFDNNPVVLAKDSSFDFYVLIYWARFIGNLNKSKVRVWESNLKNVTGCKVWVAKVNMDWQKKWREKKTE